MDARGTRMEWAPVLHRFPTREGASFAAARHVASAIRRQLEGQARASLVVAGGTSPISCLGRLSNWPLDWRRVDVILSDERWVPPDHPDSNEAMVRRHLVTRSARAVHLVGGFREQATIRGRLRELAREMRKLTLPFACSLLGMGTDGHFASLFPDAANLGQALDIDGEARYVPVDTASSPHPRISLTLGALARSDSIALLAFGERKRQVLNEISDGARQFPVARLLTQSRAPVHVFWAP